MGPLQLTGMRGRGQRPAGTPAGKRGEAALAAVIVVVLPVAGRHQAPDRRFGVPVCLWPRSGSHAQIIPF